MTTIGRALDTYARSIANFTEEEISDRMTTVGASEIGQCARKVFWIKNEGSNYGVERDADYVDTWGARMRGTVFENRFWVPAMRQRFGRRLLYAGRHQKRLEHLYLSATPDALIIGLTPAEQGEIGTEANCVLAECKTVDPRTNLTNPKEENKYQTIVQLGLVRQTTKWKPTHAIISYADASFWGDVKEFVIEFDPVVYQNAQERAAQIMTSTDVREMPPEGWIAGGHECRYCPFTRACGIERRNLPFADDDAPIDPQFRAEITDMARTLREAEEARDRDDARVRELQDELKSRLREKGIRKIAGIVSWSAVKGRSGYDNKAVQAAAVAAGVDISLYATTGEPTDRLTLLIGREDA